MPMTAAVMAASAIRNAATFQDHFGHVSSLSAMLRTKSTDFVKVFVGPACEAFHENNGVEKCEPRVRWEAIRD